MWVQVLAQPLSGSGILGESFNYTEPQSYMRIVGFLKTHLIG